MSYIVTVGWHIRSDQSEIFAGLAKQQAENSINLEPDCLLFDLCLSQDDPDQFFMYEVYTGYEAFQRHLETEHFKAFNDETTDMVISKNVQAFVKI